MKITTKQVLKKIETRIEQLQKSIDAKLNADPVYYADEVKQFQYARNELLRVRDDLKQVLGTEGNEAKNIQQSKTVKK